MQTADGIDSLGTLKGNQGTILYVTAAKLGYGTDYIVYVRTVSHTGQVSEKSVAILIIFWRQNPLFLQGFCHHLETQIPERLAYLTN
jgi:hypothetical protein